MTDSLVKISAPELTTVITRERLFEQLDTAWERPIIWITGPAGSGKTTLARSYLSARRVQQIWYVADERDTDPATFVYYLRRAVARLDADLADALPLLVTPLQADLAEFARRFFEPLYAALPRPIAIVVDDVHAMGDEGPVHTLVKHGLSTVPRGVHLVGVSRHDVPRSLARPLANGRVARITGRDLRLDAGETAEILGARVSDVDRARLPELAEALHRVTDGWAAGVVLLQAWLRVTGGTPDEVEVPAPGTLFDYFASEVLELLEPATRRFLLQTAGLPTLTPALAAEVTGVTGAGRLLERLCRRNYFTERQEGNGHRFRYHPLFRGFLEKRARSDLDEVDWLELQRRTVRALEAHDELEEAMAVAAKSEDWAELARLVRDKAPDLIAQGRVRTLEGWLERLPADVRDDNGWLLYWQGVATYHTRPPASPDLFRAALRRFREEQNITGAYHAWADWAEAASMVGGDIRPLDEAIEVVGELERDDPRYAPGAATRDLDSDLDPDLSFRVAQSMVIALMWRQPGHPDLARWTEWLAQLAQSVADPGRRISAGFGLLILDLEAGDLAHADYVLETIIGDASAAPAHQRGLVYYLRGLLAYWRARFEDCEAIATEGLEMAAAEGVPFWSHWLRGCRVMGQLGAGRWEAATAELEQLAPMAGGSPREASFYHHLRAWAALLLGRPAEAKQHHALWESKHAETGFRLHQTFEALAGAQIELELGALVEAEKRLQRATELARQRSSRTWQWAALLTRAQICRAQGDDEAFHTALAEALCHGRQTGLVCVPFWRRPVMASLCRQALAMDIEVDYAGELLRIHGLASRTAAVGPRPKPWRIHTLGRFVIEHHGEQLQFGRKQPRRALELLQALIAFGPRGAGQHRLADAVWPDAEGDAAQSSFSTTLYRLRNALDAPELLVLEGGQLSLDLEACWVDVVELDAIAAAADRLQADGTELDELADRLLDVYRGPFLSEKPAAPWILSARQRARSRFRRSAERLGRALERAGRFERAVRLIERAIEIDGADDALIRGLMRCHLELGRLRRAREAFERWAETLAEAGLEPSSSVIELARRAGASPGKPVPEKPIPGSERGGAERT